MSIASAYITGISRDSQRQRLSSVGQEGIVIMVFTEVVMLLGVLVVVNVINDV